jgi:hypothetical protein
MRDIMFDLNFTPSVFPGTETKNKDIINESRVVNQWQENDSHTRRILKKNGVDVILPPNDLNWGSR